MFDQRGAGWIFGRGLFDRRHPGWPWVRAAQVIGLTLDDLPHAARWFEAVGARRAVISGTGIANRALLAPGRVPLTPEQWSNRFGENILAAAGKAMSTAA